MIVTLGVGNHDRSRVSIIRDAAVTTAGLGGRPMVEWLTIENMVRIRGECTYKLHHRHDCLNLKDCTLHNSTLLYPFLFQNKQRYTGTFTDNSLNSIRQKEGDVGICSRQGSGVLPISQLSYVLLQMCTIYVVLKTCNPKWKNRAGETIASTMRDLFGHI